MYEPQDNDCPDGMGICPECMENCLQWGDEQGVETDTHISWRYYCPVCGWEGQYTEDKNAEFTPLPPYEEN